MRRKQIRRHFPHAPVAAFQLALAAGNNGQLTLPVESAVLATFERYIGYSVS
jgi:hypothetical protein